MTTSTQRVLTALIAAPVVVGMTIAGGWVFALGVAVVAVVAQIEFYRLIQPSLNALLTAVGLAAGVAVTLRAMHVSALWTAACLAVLAVVLLPLVRPDEPGRSLTTVLGGILYPVLPFSFLVDLRLGSGLFFRDESAFLFLTVSVFLILWVTDSAAYFVGKTIGKKPLAPTISPRKTVEGAVGGLVGALAASAILKLTLIDFLGWDDIIVLALIGGLLSPLGDLAESQMKRSAGVKDSGTILPGHGGILDRIDALIVAIPLSYFYLRYISL